MGRFPDQQHWGEGIDRVGKMRKSSVPYLGKEKNQVGRRKKGSRCGRGLVQDLNFTNASYHKGYVCQDVAKRWGLRGKGKIA